MDEINGIKLLFLSGLITAVRSSCDEPIPVIQHTYHNGTSQTSYTNGTAVAYYCNTGFRGVGDNVYTCTNNSWVGDFLCERTCYTIRELRNGKIVNQPSYSVGTRIAFECNKGYNMTGDKSLLCRADGKWRPDPPTCEIKSCGDFGIVENADIFQEDQDGQYNVYKSEIHVTCELGYVMKGSPIVQCKADGKWDAKPECKWSDCGTHPGYKSSCIADSTTSSDGSLITFLCMKSTRELSVSETGKGTALCYDGVWDNLNTGCYCDCKVEHNSTVLTHNLNVNGFLKHDTKLQWSCENGYRKETEVDLKCYDGKMNGIPSCVFIPTTTLPTTLTSTQNQHTHHVTKHPLLPVKPTSKVKLEPHGSEINQQDIKTASTTLSILIPVIVLGAIILIVIVVGVKYRSFFKQKFFTRNQTNNAQQDLEKDQSKEADAMLPETNHKPS